MFKSFAAALIPAIIVAKGTGDGTSQDNALTIELMNVPIDLSSKGSKVFTLNTYNKREVNGVDEFHGDTNMMLTGRISKPQVYGWCMERTAKVDAAAAVPAVDAVAAVAETTTQVDGKDVVTAAVPAVEAVPAVAEVLAAAQTWDC